MPNCYSGVEGYESQERLTSTGAIGHLCPCVQQLPVVFFDAHQLDASIIPTDEHFLAASQLLEKGWILLECVHAPGYGYLLWERVYGKV